MLQKKAVRSHILKLIRSLQSDKKFKDFHLVGGTALALQIGHRESIDIDLFTTNDFDVNSTLEYLEQEYAFSLQLSAKNTLKGIIDDVFIDIISHKYPIINKLIESEGIRMLSQDDIIAMKVNAIAGNGTRIKDFIDIYFLLKHHSFSDIITYYKKKYSQRNDLHAIKSLCYFGDIDQKQDWPKLLKEKDLSLETIKSSITFSKDKYFSDKGIPKS
ncbi:MAG: nucleotidyl transferase AbiEii/AbiGii toxin family protein [Bacteroidales bacterium]|nr:nucleotidyl transferase AbiEii/AbiGii toxin family protein [Bacteroidales bacterium]